MQKAILFIFCCIPFIASAQNDVLVLQKKGKHMRSYTIGSELDMETVYNQRFQGTITNMRHDSIFLNGQPWHIREIAAIHRLRSKSGFLMFGTAMMVAGGGIIVLGAVNGLYRGDKIKDWYTRSGLITAGVVTLGGYLLRRSFYIKYRIGKKYTLRYLELNPNKNQSRPF